MKTLKILGEEYTYAALGAFLMGIVFIAYGGYMFVVAPAPHVGYIIEIVPVNNTVNQSGLFINLSGPTFTPVAQPSFGPGSSDNLTDAMAKMQSKPKGVTVDYFNGALGVAMGLVLMIVGELANVSYHLRRAEKRNRELGHMLLEAQGAGKP